MTLTPDSGQIQRFVETLFCHAEQNTQISMRAFRDDADGTWRPRDWPIVVVNGSLDRIVEAAESFASQCATATVAVVFAPPVATFRQGNKATENALANGLAMSLELDNCPAQARRSLEAVLGPATVVVASGGTWVDPITGEIQDKLHCHWRLDTPTRTAIDHDFLKECRRLATGLVGGDASSIPAVHPMRWPGSWHRKGTPRLARIVECNPDVEITLATTLNKLRAAVEKRPRPNGAGHSSSARAGESTEQIAALIATVLRGENYHNPIAKLAMRYLMAGMPDPNTVETLRGIMLASIPAAATIRTASYTRIAGSAATTISLAQWRRRAAKSQSRPCHRIRQATNFGLLRRPCSKTK
jgi:hypothetical protein